MQTVQVPSKLEHERRRQHGVRAAATGDVATPVTGASEGAIPESAGEESTQPADVPSSVWRRSLVRLRRDHAVKLKDDALSASELKLEAMLLREENLRLKAERHRPLDLGALIEGLRAMAEVDVWPETTDDGWTTLSDCLVLREGLRQAALELEATIQAIKGNLAIVDDAGTGLELLDHLNTGTSAADAA